MWMEHQGKKTTHDFLSLHNKDPSFQLQDSRPPSNKGLYLRTYDFLQPLERGGEEEEEAAASEKSQLPEGTAVVAASVAHVLPGGIGTYSISHVPKEPVVKREVGTCGDSAAGGGYGGAYAGVAFALWDHSIAGESGSSPTDIGSRGPWPSPIAAAALTSFGSLSSSSRRQCHPSQPRKRSMDRSAGFDDDDDDDEYGGKRDNTSSHRGELSAKGDGKNGADQRPSTPRSKHSATEQRRRSKINDRFQILRELIPHSDQKRDKASFLLEVIEYIRFLQEKAQKYESSYPGWTEENAKLTPWVNVYFRSFWKNARNSQGPGGDGIADLSQVMKNGSVPVGFMFSENDNSAAMVPALLSAAPNPSDSDMTAGVAYKTAENPSAFASKATAASVSEPNLFASTGRGTGVAQSQLLISDAENMTSQSHPQWLRSPCPTDCTVTGDTLNGQEELAIDEGTISVSSAYSQGLLSTLSQALESSGIDLSQASISVNINLGKRASNPRPTVTTTMSSAKDQDDPSSSGNRAVGHSTVGSSGEEPERSRKRRKSDNC